MTSQIIDPVTPLGYIPEKYHSRVLDDSGMAYEPYYHTYKVFGELKEADGKKYTITPLFWRFEHILRRVRDYANFLFGVQPDQPELPISLILEMLYESPESVTHKGTTKPVNRSHIQGILKEGDRVASKIRTQSRGGKDIFEL